MTEQSVLMLGWGYPPNIEGGLDIHVAEVFGALQDTGLNITLALPKTNCPEGDEFVPLETGEGDMISRSKRLSEQFVELANDFDIVHTHDWFGSESGLKAKKYSDLKWVATVHSLASSRSRNPSNVIEKMERASVERADKITAVSKLLSSEIEEKYGRRPLTVQNGLSEALSCDIEVKMRHGIDDSRDLLLYTGRLAEQKNVELLIRAVEDLEADLLIVGEGHRREALESLSKILDIEDKVHFAGFVDAEELGDYYSAADVFVSPSKDEPFGLTITEALKAGTKVVATESGASELIQKGIFDAERNSESIRESIVEALNSECEISYIDRTWDETAEEYLEIYEDLSEDFD